MDKSIILKHYKRKDVQEAMIEHCRDKEVGVRYAESFGKRPDILNYPGEVIELAVKGVTSFHCSEERWKNPLQLSSEMTRKEMGELRIGWDLVLDIDCKLIDYSKICTDLIIKFLQYTGVTAISCKFSGNKGFHIGVPFESFPPKIREAETRTLFPEAPKKIAFYVKENIKEELGKRILEFEQGNLASIKEKTGFDKEIIRYEKNEFGDKVAKLNVEPFLGIDTILISPRHLYRAPYSLHEKSDLVSIMVDPNQVLKFEKPMAEPSTVKVSKVKFLDREVQESAGKLLLQALDFEVKGEQPEEREFKGEEIQIEGAIREEYFPPCIKLILNGITDGRKRAVFCLMNFLGKIGWDKKEITKYLLKWNKEKNPEPLRENYITSQLRYFKPGEKLPPNCDNDGYYKDMGAKCEDSLCQKIKNPVNYTLIKWKRNLQNREKESKPNQSQES
ncbi:MAG: hypothetical protein ABIA37_05150 [Candidatus Woesearchaeota archaeon]